MAALRSWRTSTQQGISKFRLSPLQLAGELVPGENSKAGKDPTNDFATRVQTTKLTQESQDNTDREDERKAMHALVQTWMENLQLISVIATFFVSTEVTFLGITIPSPTNPRLSAVGQVANIGLITALIVHAHAAIISFLAAFFLVRHKLAVAQKEEQEAEENLVDSPTSISLNDPEKARRFRTSDADDVGTDFIGGRVRISSLLTGDRIIWSTNPHLVQVGPFQGRLPTHLLARCHSLCVLLTFLGFLLALMGTISYVWDQLPRSISIFISVSTCFCLVAVILILITPSTKTSHIYYYNRNSPSR